MKYHHYYVQNTLDRQQKRKDRLKEGLAKLRIIDTTVPLKVQCHKIFCHWTCHESFFFHFGLVFTEFLKLKNWKKPLLNCKKSTSFLITFSGGVINISWHSLFNNMSADQGPQQLSKKILWHRLFKPFSWILLQKYIKHPRAQFHAIGIFRLDGATENLNICTTVYTVQCTVYTCTVVYSMYCIVVYSTYCTVYSMYCTVYSMYCTMYIVQYVRYSWARLSFILGDRIEANLLFCTRTIWRIEKFSDSSNCPLVQNTQRGKELNQFYPHIMAAAATTFAFSSVFIHILCTE